MPVRGDAEARGDAAAGPRRLVAWIPWLAAIALVTAGMAALRGSLGTAHVVLGYLLLVLIASARAGRAVGLTLAVLAFWTFNFFFLPPFHTLAVAEPLDLLVLAAFLATSAVAAQLLSRAQREAAEARQRAAEVDRLAALGSEALNAGRAEEALEAVAQVIAASVNVSRCEVYLREGVPDTVAAETTGGPARFRGAGPAGAGAVRPMPPAGDDRHEHDVRAPGVPDVARLVAWVGTTGRPAAVRSDDTLRFGDADAFATAFRPGGPSAAFDWSGARRLLLPLRVRDRTVGVLVLLHDDGIVLDESRARMLGALAYYAALGAERVRLAAEAEHARALREADRLKDAVLASVSHDLRTPLTTIKALAHAMGAEGDERAAIIEVEADRLNRLVADLLDLSRLSGGALAVAPELNTADDVVGAALQQVSGAAGARAIRVSLDPTETLLVGRFDFAYALRILVNLIENALKYAPADAPIEIDVRRTSDAPACLEFVVADRGPGVPPAERERIFDRFYRPTGSPPDTGSVGLGLAISRGLAEAQGGSLHQEARAGGGSRFVLRLPAADLGELADLPLV